MLLVPIGFIHYQFNWYRSIVSSSSTSGTTPVVANVVFNIVHVACLKNKDETQATCKSSKPTSPPQTGIMLILLSMEHARSWEVHYGLIDALDDGFLPQYFRHFFRAEVCFNRKRSIVCNIETTNNEQKAHQILPMIVDLAKTSYRYTLFQPHLNEGVTNSYKSSAQKSEPDNAWCRRLLIQLPNKRDTTLMLQSGPEVLQYRQEGMTSAGKENSVSHKNADESTWNKRIKVSIESVTSTTEADEKTPQSNEIEAVNEQAIDNATAPAKIMTTTTYTITPPLDKDGRIPSSHKCQSNENRRRTELLSSTTDARLDLKCPTWKILRSFPIAHVNSRINSNKIKSNKTTTNDLTSDEICSALISKQNKLRKLEASLSPQLANILRALLKERHDYNLNNAANIQNEEKIYAAYKRTLEDSLAKADKLQAQIEADMNAVCSICVDGNITSDNQILFCESCNVAVHQKCYMIEKVPSGDWFCKVCRYFKRDLLPKDSNTRQFKPTICCELCPIKSEGAFVQMYDPNTENARRWIHVVCAKWSGLYYVESNDGDTEFIESVEPIKLDFLKAETTCCICEGRRGAYVKCREFGCDSFVHLLCARLSGKCKVVHGDRAEGPMIENKLAWTLCCPTHSAVPKSEVPEGAISISALVKLSESFPPEHIPEPPMPHVDEFNGLIKEEREKWMSHPSGEFEKEMLQIFMRRISGAICQVCNVQHTGGGAGSATAEGLIRCAVCHVTTHAECYNGNSENISKLRHASSNGRYVCDACSYVKVKEKANDSFEVPQCNMCNMKNGALKKAFAIPYSKKMRKNNPSQYARTLFGKQIWCHSLCGLWHPAVKFHFPIIEAPKDSGASTDGGDTSKKLSPKKKQILSANDHGNSFDCTNVIMSSGFTHINATSICALCGRFDRVKVGCFHQNCTEIEGDLINFEFHLTCARQAGLDVSDVGKTYVMIF